MWEIFSGGEMPYAKMPNPDVVEKICHQNYRLSRPKDCPTDVYQIIRSCWQTVRKIQSLMFIFQLSAAQRPAFRVFSCFIDVFFLLFRSQTRGRVSKSCTRSCSMYNPAIVKAAILMITWTET